MPQAYEAVQLRINTLADVASRELFNAALLQYFQGQDTACEKNNLPVAAHKDQLSSLSQERLKTGKPLRILDSKEPNDVELCQGAPRLEEYINTHSKDWFQAVKAGLDDLDIPYEVDHHLVRGLDY